MTQDNCKYYILISELSSEEISFNYNLNSSFFNDFEFKIFNDAYVEFNINCIKKEDYFLIQFKWNGKVNLNCDRCYDEFSISIIGSESITCKYSDETSYEDDEILISHKSDKIYLDQILYDLVSLSIPMNNMHKIEDCNIESINILNKITVKNKNDNDPRWDKLKNLIKK